jgi:predicted GNAT family acetyltransferase
MRILKETDRAALLEYLAAEPEYNLFFIGDVENFGLEGAYVTIAAHEKDDAWDSVTLRYMDFFLVYSRKEDYDAAAVAAYIRTQPACDVISGKGSVLRRLAPFFPARTCRATCLSRCDRPADYPFTAAGLSMRRLAAEDAAAIVALFCGIGEFRENYLGKEAKRTEEERIKFETGSGSGFGVFDAGGALLATALTSAENSMSAMVVGVATRPGWRRRGLASAAVGALCRDCLRRGMRFLCLFYDNPEAGRIYRRIGFTELGEYIMMK